MSFVKVLVHAVWATKNRQPVMINGKREVLQKHIWQYALSKKVVINCIGGYHEHLHCLFSLNVDQSVAEVLKLIKGESSFWANKQGLFEAKFQWGQEFFAASVSESALEKVRGYILNQEVHHQQITFEQEFGRFKKSYGFTVNPLKQAGY